MGRIRVAGIIKMPTGYAFMYRTGVNKGGYKEYYTFAGGGLEEGETLEEGVLREINEEFGIDVEIVKKMYDINIQKFDQKEYFFFCKYKSGKFGSGTGPEFNNDPKYIDSGKFIPKILLKEEIEDILLLPLEIKEKFVLDLKNGKFD